MAQTGNALVELARQPSVLKLATDKSQLTPEGSLRRFSCGKACVACTHSRAGWRWNTADGKMSLAVISFSPTPSKSEVGDKERDRRASC